MIKSRSQITPVLLNELLKQDAETGKLYWRARRLCYFSSQNACAAWNGKHAAKEAFVTKDAYGYHRGRIFCIDFLSHRVVWAMHYGEWPKYKIDHINGDKTDNRIANLRDVSDAENAKNMPIQFSNTSGTVGVGWCSQRQKWLARITVNRRCKNLGRFTEKSDAIAARKAAEQRFGFHPNHGRPACDPLRGAP